MAYGDPEKLKKLKGVQPKHLWLDEEPDPDAALTAELSRFLQIATDLINANRNRDYEQEVADGERAEVPPGIVQIAYRLAANQISYWRAQQKADMVKTDDYAERVMSGRIFTRDIRDDLEHYPKGGVASGLGFRVSRVRSRREVEEAQAT